MVDFVNLTQKIEIAKRKISIIGDRSVVIETPPSLVHTEEEIECLKNAIQEANLQDMVNAKLGKLIIKNVYFLKYFQIICGKTVDLVTSIIQNDNLQVRSIVLVGGFSESIVVQKIFKDSFPKNNVLIPMEAGMAVLKGAVIYGFNSSIVQS